MRKLGDHAVILGAGRAGLLAARVLSDAYERVTLVERDRLPTKPERRRGVPQGRHAHVLVPAGTQVLHELFPGLLDDLVAGGVPVIRDLGELRFSPAGHRLCLTGRPPQPFVCQASRPFLEGHLRARVRALPTVEILDRCEVVGFVTTSAETGSPGCGCSPTPLASKSASTPTWSWTPPGAAAGRRPGWRRSATTYRRKCSSRSI
jgi:2-polyprenyl-6-methoxyphenol hydroxylase-like FAD-dependent oxidoreductase